MPLTPVTNTIVDPTGTGLGSITVVISLVPPSAYRIANVGGGAAGTEIAPQIVITTNISGVWTANLEPQSNITPANSYYVVEEQLPPNSGGPRLWYIVVPATGVSTQLTSILAPRSAYNP